ncbi:MAG: hypothetical protein SFU53_05975 [Terrimicrobiaceae bacterium]|nr:hypothetical protein [Terrimicrobiaceae bacterium]
MKTTLDIPDTVFRQAKATAALRGISLRQLVTEALREKFADPGKPATPAWMAGFGELADLRQETQAIDAAIRKEFDVLDAEDRS